MCRSVCVCVCVCVGMMIFVSEFRWEECCVGEEGVGGWAGEGGGWRGGRVRVLPGGEDPRWGQHAPRDARAALIAYAPRFTGGGGAQSPCSTSCSGARRAWTRATCWATRTRSRSSSRRAARAAPPTRRTSDRWPRSAARRPQRAAGCGGRGLEPKSRRRTRPSWYCRCVCPIARGAAARAPALPVRASADVAPIVS